MKQIFRKRNRGVRDTGKKRKPGFTLVEVLVYIAVLSIIGGSITGLGILIYRYKTIMEDRVNVNEDMRVLVKSIRDDMYLGRSVNVASTTSFTITDSSGDDITYALVGDQVTRQVELDPAVAITAETVDVRTFSVDDVTTPNVAGTIRITIELANFPSGTLKPVIVQEVTTTIGLKFL